MRICTIFLAIITAVLISGCNVQFISQDVRFEHQEKLEFSLEKDKWYLATNLADENKALKEYLRPYENRYNFVESIGASFSSYKTGASIDIEFNKLKSGVKSHCPNASFEIISNLKKEMIYVWNIKDCEVVRDQYEIGRFIVGETGIHRAAYVLRIGQLSEKNRSYGISLITNAKLTHSASGAQ